jgi:Co/Zn/Cd efflux system component
MTEMIAGVFLIGATLFVAVELIDRFVGEDEDGN